MAVWRGTAPQLKAKTVTVAVSTSVSVSKPAAIQKLRNELKIAMNSCSREESQMLSSLSVWALERRVRYEE